METINAILCIIDGKVNLLFEIDDESINLNLESDDSIQIKQLFLSLAKKIRSNPLQVKLVVDPKFEMNSNKLFYDTSVEYIEQLNKELKFLEEDDDLIRIRSLEHSNS
ncbi:MAG: hypothetical protein HFI09_02675 [Bacilli bacterium]|nr:hypothetical protein [Bacilli bacterium]